MLTVPAAIDAFWRTQPDKSASQEAISDLEASVGGRIPEEYKEYLSKYGYKQFEMGGYIYIDARYDMNLEIVEKEVLLRFLLHPDGVKERLRVFGQPMQHADDVGPRIPPDMLPIGEAAADTSGLLLMQLGEKNYGSIWYWERVDETWGSGENTLLGAVGRDLNDMLAKVREEDG